MLRARVDALGHLFDRACGKPRPYGGDHPSAHGCGDENFSALEDLRRLAQMRGAEHELAGEIVNGIKPARGGGVRRPQHQGFLEEAEERGSPDNRPFRLPRLKTLLGSGDRLVRLVGRYFATPHDVERAVLDAMGDRHPGRIGDRLVSAFQQRATQMRVGVAALCIDKHQVTIVRPHPITFDSTKQGYSWGCQGASIYRMMRRSLFIVRVDPHTLRSCTRGLTRSCSWRLYVAARGSR